MPSDALAGQEVVLGVSDFVAVLNQTLDYAYPDVVIMGELANLRVSKNRWVYFDLKDEISSVKFFGTVRQLPGPLEDGMLLRVRGAPRLHHQYGFSVNVINIQPAGEGSIRRASQLLQAKLAAEGLFDEARKRGLPYPPATVGLVTSKESAAYADFTKIMASRWQGVAITLIDVQVQGEAAPAQIVAALERFNELAEPPEVIVLIRGGGSPEDLAAFSTEPVARAVASSRVPTLAAIGHETDLSLAELAADKRASTPSNAAELLVPDRQAVLRQLHSDSLLLGRFAEAQIRGVRESLMGQAGLLGEQLELHLAGAARAVASDKQLLEALNPEAVLKRGYAIVRQNGKAVRSARRLSANDIVDVELTDGRFRAAVQAEKAKKDG
ncbi:MAG TPA: exodeoxyribonuclease VII large subunit [Candidatus Saccharimonadales bacterium]|nr:exodeoxyribonuclease VII large subunit [Candidatus Saccharimonadales bacterium]